jgi:hypothetical protein
MSLVVAGPLGMMFGFVTWAALRGRGGLPGLILFVMFGCIGAWMGGLAAEAASGAVSDGVVALGGVIGATLASLTEVVAFGRAPRTA